LIERFVAEGAGTGMTPKGTAVIPVAPRKQESHMQLIRKFSSTGLFAALLMTASWPISSLAVSMTPTLMQESSTTWQMSLIDRLAPFTSETDDPLGFLQGRTVTFRGYTEGGSAEELLYAHLVYRIRLDFDVPAILGKLSLVSAGDNNSGGNNAVFRLLDANMDVIQSLTLTGYNTVENFQMDGDKAFGSTFYVDQFDYSTQWRSLHSLSVDYAAAQPVPETPTALLFGSGLALILARMRRRLSK
jgi:hypothetical protein